MTDRLPSSPTSKSAESRTRVSEVVGGSMVVIRTVVSACLLAGCGQSQAADSPLVTSLRELPDVVAVDVPLRSQNPRCTIVHVLDWHLVGKEAFSADVQDEHGTIGPANLRLRRWTSYLSYERATQRKRHENRRTRRIVCSSRLTRARPKHSSKSTAAKCSGLGRLASLNRATSREPQGLRGFNPGFQERDRHSQRPSRRGRMN